MAGRHLAFLVPLGLVGTGAFYLLYFYNTVRESTVDPNKLEWAPPVLNNPTTINITSTGYTDTKLDTTKVIRIDKFTGSSNYQGIFTGNGIGAGIYKRTSLFYQIVERSDRERHEPLPALAYA